jgi:hypothetical protein
VKSEMRYLKSPDDALAATAEGPRSSIADEDAVMTVRVSRASAWPNVESEAPQGRARFESCPARSIFCSKHNEAAAQDAFWCPVARRRKRANSNRRRNLAPEPPEIPGSFTALPSQR